MEYTPGQKYTDEEGTLWQYEGDDKWTKLETPIPKPKKTPTLGERFEKNLAVGIETNILPAYRAAWKYLSPDSEALKQEVESSRKVLADYEATPSWYEQPTLGGKVGHGLAALSGQFIPAIFDPVNAIPVGPAGKGLSMLKTMGVQGAKVGALNVATDPLYQAADIYTGVQDEYDPLRTVISGAIGGVVGGSLGGLGKLTDDVVSRRKKALADYEAKQQQEILDAFTGTQKSAEDVDREFVSSNVFQSTPGYNMRADRFGDAPDPVVNPFAQQYDMSAGRFTPMLPFTGRAIKTESPGVASALEQLRNIQEQPAPPQPFEKPGVPGRGLSYEIPTGEKPVGEDMPGRRDDPEELTGRPGFGEEEEGTIPGYTDEGLRIIEPTDPLTGEPVEPLSRIGETGDPLVAKHIPESTYSQWVKTWRDALQQEINAKQERLKQLNDELKSREDSAYLDEDDFNMKQIEADELTTDIETLRMEQKEFENSYRTFVMEKLKEDVTLELTKPLTSKVIQNWEKTLATKGKNATYWDFLNELTYLGKSASPNKENLRFLWEQTKKEKSPGKPRGKLAEMDIRPMISWIENNLPEDLGKGKTRTELLNYIKQTFGGLIAAKKVPEKTATTTKGINIFSGSNDTLGRALTNPTHTNPKNPSAVSTKRGGLGEYSFLDKGIEFAGKVWKDVEEAYHALKEGYANKKALLTDIMTAKLQQYPKLVEDINSRGGLGFLENSWHTYNNKGRPSGGGTDYWTTNGQNNFITALIDAYKKVSPTTPTKKTPFKTTAQKLSLKYPDTISGFTSFLREHTFGHLNNKSLATTNDSRPTVATTPSIDERIAQLVQAWQELLGFANPQRISGKQQVVTAPRQVTKRIEYDLPQKSTEDKTPTERIYERHGYYKKGGEGRRYLRGVVETTEETQTTSVLPPGFEEQGMANKQVVIVNDKDIPEIVFKIFPETASDILGKDSAATNYIVSKDLDLIVLREGRRKYMDADLENYIRSKLGNKATPEQMEFMRNLYTLTHEYAHTFWRSVMAGLHKFTWGNDSSLMALRAEFGKWVRSRQKQGLSAEDYLRQAATHPRLQSFTGPRAEEAAAVFGREIIPNAEVKEWMPAFKEFLAEQTVRKLLSKKFEKETPLGSIANRIRAIYETTAKYIKNLFGVDIPAEKFVNDFINTHISKAQDVWDKTAKTVYDSWSSAVFNKKASYTPGEAADDSIPIPFVNRQPPHPARAPYAAPADALAAQKALTQPDLGALSGKALSRIFGSPTWLRMITERSPFMHKMLYDLWNIEQKWKMNELDMLLGEVDWNQWQLSGKLMTRQHNKKGIKEIYKVLKNDELLDIMNALHEGSKLRRPYLDTYNANSARWSNDQKVAFAVSATYFKKMWDLVTQQQLLSGKRTLPYHEGWFPTFRGGEHIIIVTDPVTSLPKAVYTMYSKVELKKAKKYLDSQGIHYTEAKNDKPGTTFVEPPLEAAIKYVENIAKDPILAGQLRQLETTMDISYGKFGKHHEMRTDIAGFWGDRPWRSKTENADDFRQAIYNSMGDFMRFAMRTEMIREYQPSIDAIKADKDLPNLATAAEIYYNRAVGINPEPITRAEKWIEYFSRKALDLPGVPFNREQPAWNAISNGMSQIFYLLNLVSKPSFWISQATSPMLSWRAVDRLWADKIGGMTGIEAYARSWWSMNNPSPDLYRALHWAATKTETFNPQFVQDMHRLNFFDNRLMSGDIARKVGNNLAKVTDILTGQKQSEIGDSWSRFQTFVMMYESLKKAGFNGEELYRLAAQETDASMIAYRTSARPAYIGAMGSIGEAMAPLTTFAHGQSGNIYGDLMNAIAYGGRNPRMFLPMLSTTAAAFLLAGLVGMPLLAEYELIAMAYNKIASKAGINTKLPSLIEMMITNKDIENRVMQDMITHGAMSGATSTVVEGGVDIGASQRYAPFITRYMESMGDIGALFPALGFGVDLAGAIGTIAQDSLFENTGIGKPVPTADYNRSVRSMMPGYTKGFVDSGLIGRKSQGPDYENVTHTAGKGYGGVIKKEGENIAPYLGVRSMDQVKASEAMRRSQQKETTFQNKKQEWAQIYIDAYMENNPQKLDEAQKVLGSMGATPDILFELVLQGAYKRNTPQTATYGVGQYGKSSMSNTAMRKQMELQRWLQQE